MEKWREKHWRARGGGEQPVTGEEDLTAEEKSEGGREFVGEVGRSTEDVGDARGHSGEGNTWGSLRNEEEDGEATTTRGVRGGDTEAGESGMESGDVWANGEGMFGEFGGRGLFGEDGEQRCGGVWAEESAAETDVVEPAAETGVEEPAAETGVEESAAETDEGDNVPWAATAEEDHIFGNRRGYPTDRRPASFRRDLSGAPAEVIDAWFAESKIPIGEAVQKDPEKMRRVKQLMYTWKDAFITETSKMVGTDLVFHSIPTWENAIPVRAKAKLYTPKERKWMEANIPQLLEAKIIEHSVSPWSHRTKFVPKKDGDLRMVHVYCPINAATIPNAYPMKRIEPVLNNLLQSGLSVYFQADAANGYWAVPLVPEHAYKTAFDTHMGQYHYLRMGQGLAGAPQTYTRLKDIFAGPIPGPNPEPALNNTGIPGAFETFVDDDYGAHRSFEDQFQFLHEHYFPRLLWSGLTIKPRKSGFFLDSISPLGFEASGSGLRPSCDKVRAIREYPTPANWDELKAFLHLTTYLRQFIPGRSDRALAMQSAATLEPYDEWVRQETGRYDKNGKPIRKPRRVIKWEWGERQQQAFDELKAAILNNAIFGGSEHLQYHLATDASKTGIGGVLFQLPECEPGTIAAPRNRDRMRIIMFISKRLEPAETRYSTTEQEALAVVRCLAEVRWLVLGAQYPTKVYTDHSALISVLRHDDAHGRIGKWQMKLSEYDVEYVHVPGTQNVIADGMSRLPARYFKKGDPRLETEREGVGTAVVEKLGGGKTEIWEVAAVTEGERTQWEKWLESEWYGDVVRYLLVGSLEGADLTARGRRMVRQKARRYRMFDGNEKGLFYVERDGKSARCVDENEVLGILRTRHDHHGHFGGKMLLSQMIGKYYWPTRAKDTAYYARTCKECQLFGPLRPSAGIRPIVHLQPMDMIGLDFIGPISPVSTSGNRYIVILVDYFTRHIFAHAAPQATGEAARKLLESVVNLLGWPLSVYTDNGTHFTGKDFHGLLEEKGIRHFPAPKSHPESVGLAERYVQLLMSVLKREVQQGDKVNWDKRIPGVLSTLNTRALRVHGFTPAELLFGFNPRSDTQGTLDELFTIDGLDRTAYGLRFTSIDEARETAASKTTQAADAIEQQSEGRWTPLEEGDLVLLRRFEIEKLHGQKLEPQWEGPYRLFDMSPHGRSARLQDIHTGDPVRVRKGGLRERVHVNDLKLFCPRQQNAIGKVHVVEGNLVEMSEWRAEWTAGKRKFCLADAAELVGSQASEKREDLWRGNRVWAVSMSG